MVDNFYAPKYQRTISYNDKDLNIDWGVDKSKLILSHNDNLNHTYNWKKN